MTNNAQLDGLSEGQHTAIVALLSQPTVRDAARVAQVSEFTLHRWLREDANFKAAYMAARRELFSHAIARLQHAAGQAVQTLIELAQPPHTEPTRLRAAAALLDYAFRGVDVEDIRARIDRIEQALNEDAAARGNHWPR